MILTVYCASIRTHAGTYARALLPVPLDARSAPTGLIVKFSKLVTGTSAWGRMSVSLATSDHLGVVHGWFTHRPIRSPTGSHDAC